jgi:DNA mismatch repair ATPase MutS
MQKYLKDHGIYNKIFKGIYTMDYILERFQKGRVEEEDWRKLSKSLENIYELRKCLPYLNLPSIVKKFVDNENWPKIVELIHLIQKTITISPLMVKDEFN